MAWITGKEVVELVKKGATIEAQERIMELREEAVRLKEENIKLKKRIADLNFQLEIKKNLEYEHQVYWIKKGNGTRDGPYCPLCYDKDRMLIRLILITHVAYEDPHYSCGYCNSYYRKIPMP
jgi:hypothetical protein